MTYLIDGILFFLFFIGSRRHLRLMWTLPNQLRYRSSNRHPTRNRNWNGGHPGGYASTITIRTRFLVLKHKNKRFCAFHFPSSFPHFFSFLLNNFILHRPSLPPDTPHRLCCYFAGAALYPSSRWKIHHEARTMEEEAV